MSVTTIEVGHVYRGKNLYQTREGFVNDRGVLWISDDGQTVQYDSPSVRMGGRYPKVSREAFLNWAGSDVTDELPAAEWATWESIL